MPIPQPNLRGLVDNQVGDVITRLVAAVNALESGIARFSTPTSPAVPATPFALTPATLRAIRDALQVGGATPLNVTKLLGIESFVDEDLIVTGNWTFQGTVSFTNTVTFSGSVVLSGFTAGSILFAGSGGLVSQDNANLFFNDTSNSFGLGVNAFGTNGVRVFGMGLGTAPTTRPTDMIQMYVADAAAGDARLYILTESGTTPTVIGNGIVSTGAGAVGTPAFTFGLDPDTGIYNSGTNELSITTGGVAGLTVTSAQNVLAAHVISAGGTSQTRGLFGSASATAHTSGVTQAGLAIVNLVITSGATTAVDGSIIGITTPNSAFTTPSMYGYRFNGVSKGAAHTITSIAGFASASLASLATNSVYALLGTTTIPSGNWVLYSPITNLSYLAGGIKIGATTTRATTQPTMAIDLFDGTAPVGTLVNGCSIYSVAGTLTTMNSAGTAGTIVHTGNTSVLIANEANNRIVTSIGANAGLNAEANLTFDGSILATVGRITVNQSSTTGAVPVAHFTQADVSEEFLRFQGSAAAATLTQSIVAAADVATFTPAGYLKLYVIDDGNQITDQAYYVQIGTLA